MRPGLAIAGLVLLAIVAARSLAQTLAGESAVTGPMLVLIVPIALLSLVGPIVCLLAAGLLTPQVRDAWRVRRGLVIVLAALLLVPLPATSRHFSDAAGPQNPRGYYPGEPSWMFLGAAVATGGRVGPLGASFEFDETILTGAWTLAPLAWVAGLAGVVLTSSRPRTGVAAGA